MDKGFKSKVLELKSKGFSSKKIAKLLGCAVSTVSFHCKSAGISAASQIPTDEDIKHWNEVYQRLGSFQEVAKVVGWHRKTVSKYLETFRRKKLNVAEQKKSAVQAVSKRRRAIKQMAVQYKGGKCEICGYNKCAAAMDFHHRNPSLKKFSLSIRGLSRSLEAIKDELDKCALLCANCHREFHAGVASL